MADKKTVPQRKQTSDSSFEHLGAVRMRALLAAGIQLVVLLGIFGSVLSPQKTFNAGDNIASEAVLPYLKAAQESGTSVPQWIPNIFCGMPSFASLLSTGTRTYDILYNIFNIIRTGVKSLAGGSDGVFMLLHYFIFGFGVYLFLRKTRDASWIVSLFGALAAMMSTWVLTFAMIGHNTKIYSVMCFPYILLILEMLRKGNLKWYEILGWVSALGVAIHFLLEATHVQMAFYQGLIVLIYFLTWLIRAIVKKENVTNVLRTGALSILAAGAAFAMSADRYMATLGYDPYSIRGSAPIVERGDKRTPTDMTKAKSGLDWDYATSYSFSPQEMLTFVVPGWYGFGKLPYKGPETGNEEVSVPTYWGQMLGTDAANYTGIIILFLGLMGIVVLRKRDHLITPLALGALVGLLLSFGGNFTLLFKPMFEYFPGFNKFRAPMMALIMMQLTFPIIAALTFEKILRAPSENSELKNALAKHATVAMYIFAGLFVIFLVGRGSFDSSLRSSIASSGKPIASYPDSIKDLAVSTALNDAVICALIGLAAFALLSFYLKGKVRNSVIVAVGVTLLCVIDLWRVGIRPLEVTTKADLEQVFRGHDYVDFIKQDSSLYRVLDLNESTSNIPISWGMQTIAGYHAAKIRRFQDVVDVTGNAQGHVIYNPFMWDLLNTKYIIADGAIDSVPGRFIPAFISKEQKQSRDGKQKQPTVVWQNPTVLPRVFFVNRAEVKQPLAILEAMRDGKFDPRNELYVEEASTVIDGVHPLDSSSTDKITITSYANERVEMKAQTTADRLAFFSDTWYPSWHLTIDGKPANFVRANYAFRAFKIPSGDHTIIWEYHDPAYESGRGISLGANILIILGLIAGFGYERLAKKKSEG
jgi:hypothetical protein